MTLKEKMWMYFINAKSFPAQHVTEVSRGRALLLYAILQMWKINVEPQICHNMRQCAKGHTRGLPYPYLITEMCKQAGATIDPKEPTCLTKGILDDVIYVWFCNQRVNRVKQRNEKVAAH